jgi:hypothetical protein
MNTDSHTRSNRPPPDREKVRASLHRLVEVYDHYLNVYSQLNPTDCPPASQSDCEDAGSRHVQL